MQAQLRSRLKKVPLLSQWFAARSAHPGDWIYNRSTLAWTVSPGLRQQLPLLYQLFGIYSALYFKLTGATYLRDGRKVFLAIAKLSNRLSRLDYIQLRLPKYDVYLEPSDPRLFAVVDELMSDRADTRILTELLTEGDTFIDVGANHGSFSIVASQLVGKSGRVIAIEPQPRLATAVERSLEANQLGNFQVYQTAVGDRSGEIELLIPQDTSGSAGVYSAHSGTHQHQVVQVPLQRFDDLLNWQALPGTVLLKLDVEGSEYAFLVGAREAITTLRPSLIMEIHPKTLSISGKTQADLLALLQELGYTHYAELETLQQRSPIELLDTKPQRNIVAFMRPK
jgi:FkbM family methyltransferase